MSKKRTSETEHMFWMTATKGGTCSECESDINTGDRIVWSPTRYRAYDKTCGEDLIGEDPQDEISRVNFLGPPRRR